MRSTNVRPVSVTPAAKSIRLPNGRALSFREFGARDGRAILYCHGTPGASVEWELFGGDLYASQAGIRLIAADRPGMGGSDPQPGRTQGSWAADASALADACGLDTFAVLGYSGGTGPAAACAHSLSARVSGCALVASVCHASPAFEEGLDPNGLRLKRLVRERPVLGRIAMAAAMGWPTRMAPGYLVRQAMKTLPDPDRAVLSRPGGREAFVATVRASFRQGAGGPREDMALMVTPWDFAPEDIRVPVMIWQGTQDTFGARPAMAEYLHRAIPHSRLELLPEGHLSIMWSHRDAILGSLVP
ncbi:MAG: alpha/beta fold hydrolase [Actinomycetota bacterium]